MVRMIIRVRFIVHVSFAVVVGWCAETNGQIDIQLADALPRQGRPDEYVLSVTCAKCHPREHKSWYSTFHRTMTQVAGQGTVLGRFDNVQLESRGRKYWLERRGDSFWVQMADPDGERNRRAEAGQSARSSDPGQQPPRVWKRIVMTTGSHHMQAYWFSGGRGRQLVNFPFLYLIDRQQWIPREDAFLRSPDFGPIAGIWNDNCIDCHSVGGQPGLNPRTGTMDTRVAELGIACEACHGPGKEHLRAVGGELSVSASSSAGNPLLAKKPGFLASQNVAIVNPSRCSVQTSSQICGQCHGVTFVKNVADWMRNGFRYRPGRDLEKTRYIPRPALDQKEPWIQRLLAEWPTFLDEYFWTDGMIRVSGREYNGLIVSSCYLRGEMSCLSCHSMHRSDPEDQLASGMEGNQACLQCHKEYAAKIPQHTHHPASSQGSQCYNCHMPHTTFGLLKAMRSHQIDSPSVASSIRTGRPNACNLCHLDQTLDWTAGHLSDWYDQPAVDVSEQQREISASLLWLLRGDAGQRALVAWSMGWEPALHASGRRWQAPFLAQLLSDPYSAVRFVAHRSLCRLPGYRNYGYDFIGPPVKRDQARQRVLDIWNRTATGAPDRRGAKVLISRTGGLQQITIDQLLHSRDDRRIYLAE